MSEPTSRFSIKNRKSLPKPWIIATIMVVSLGLLSVGIFLYYTQYKDVNTSSQPTRVLAKIDGQPDGLPLYFTSPDGTTTVLENGQVQEIPSGQYTVKTAIDGQGQLDESVMVSEAQANTYTFKLKPIDSTQSSQSSIPLQPATSNTSLALDSSLNGATPSQTQISPNTTDPKNTTIAVVTHSTGAEGTKIEVSEPHGNKINLAEGCSITKMYLTKDSSALRYFKNCASSGQNGFYSADLSSGSETRLLDSSDPSNTQRVDISPTSDDIVFAKQTGEFGFVRNNQVTVVTTDTNIVSPSFSPDGMYVIYGKRGGQNTTSRSFYDTFPMQVVMVKTSDLIERKDKAEFKTLGQSYIVPTGSPYGNDFITWLDNSKFLIGDSPRIFNISGEVITQNEDPLKPGRLYTGTDGKVYRQLAGTIFDSTDKALVQNVQKIVQIPNHGFYYIASGYLSRINNGQPTIAFTEPILNYQVNGTQLILLTKKGTLQMFSIA